MRSLALELGAERVAVRERGRGTRAELAGAYEAVGIAQAGLPRRVSLELRHVTHRHFFAASDGPQRAHLRREHIFVPPEERVRGAADDKLYRKREGVGRAMGVKTLPVVDTGDDRAGRAVRCVMSRQRPDSPVVRSQDPDDFVLVAVVQRE